MRARAEVLVVFIVDNLCPAGSTGPRGRRASPQEGVTKGPNPRIMWRLGARLSPRPELPRQPKQLGSSTIPPGLAVGARGEQHDPPGTGCGSLRQTLHPHVKGPACHGVGGPL